MHTQVQNALISTMITYQICWLEKKVCKKRRPKQWLMYANYLLATENNPWVGTTYLMYIECSIM
jgi:hypothetical protein